MIKLRLRYTDTPMRLHNSLAITAALVTASAFSASAQMANKVELHDGQGNSVGTAELSAASSGVSIRLDLKNLSPGEHAATSIRT